MGASFYAGYGVKIKADRLYKEREKPGCGCLDLLKGSGKFCPNCGAPVIVGREVPVDGYDPDRGWLYDLKVVKLLYCDDVYVFYYYTKLETNSISDYKLYVTSTEKARDHLRAVMEPLGLWDEASFGLWLVAHVSR